MAKFKSGRTIGQQREKLETAGERQAARAKAKRHRRVRLFTVSLLFVALIGCLAALSVLIFGPSSSTPVIANTPVTVHPTIEIVDEDTGNTIAASSSNQVIHDATTSDNSDGATSGTTNKITNRMLTYIGQAEADFRDLGYQPVRAVLPTGSVREVDFYLDGYPGFIKLWIDRDTAPSVEDADRLLRYLKDQGITDFQYLDVRLPYKAYWR